MGARQSLLKGDAQHTDANALTKWEATVREEEAIHAAAIPVDEIPSCMNLFDEWGKCFALMPQLRHVYQFGKMNDCKTKLENFKHCLTIKGVTKEEHRAIYIRRKAELSAAKRLECSSENVWEMRRDPIVDPQYADPEIPSPL